MNVQYYCITLIRAFDFWVFPKIINLPNDHRCVNAPLTLDEFRPGREFRSEVINHFNKDTFHYVHFYFKHNGLEIFLHFLFGMCTHLLSFYLHNGYHYLMAASVSIWENYFTEEKCIFYNIFQVFHYEEFSEYTRPPTCVHNIYIHVIFIRASLCWDLSLFFLNLNLMFDIFIK